MTGMIPGCLTCACLEPLEPAASEHVGDGA
jgi:hypothetical protein